MFADFVLTVDAAPVQAFIATVAIVFAVVAIALFRGKYLAEKKHHSRRGYLKDRYYPEDISAPQGAEIKVDIPRSQPKYLVAEQETARQILNCQAFLAQHQWQEADGATRKTLSYAVKSLTQDHWLIAVCLNLRASYLMERGNYAEAFKLLTPAAAIISEWPGDLMADRAIAQIDTNHARCKKRLGY